MGAGRGLGVLVLALGMACGAMAARADGIGACAWGKAAEGGQRAVFLAAFARSPRAGTAQLEAADAALRGYVAQCARRGDLPLRWARGAIASVALQDGAAQAVATASRIARPALDAAWARAPAAARDCARGNAARAFGLTGPACPNPGAGLLFLEPLGIAPAMDRAGAMAAFTFMNAKAQEEWAESLIARFLRERAAP